MKKSKDRSIRTILLFFITAFIVQYLGTLFFSASSLQKLLPLYIRAVTNEVKLDDDSYTEYYSIRNELLGVPVIVVGVDFSHEESYRLLYDFLSALKINIQIGTLIMAVEADQSFISEAITAEDEQTFMQAMEALQQRGNFRKSMYDFLDSVHNLNESLPPQRRIYGGIIENDAADFESSVVAAASRYYENTQSTTLVVVDSAWLNDGALFRKTVESEYDSWTILQCKYIERENWFFEKNDESTVVLANRSRFRLFDKFYSIATTGGNSKLDTSPFSHGYATENFFVIFGHFQNPS